MASTRLGACRGMTFRCLCRQCISTDCRDKSRTGSNTANSCSVDARWQLRFLSDIASLVGIYRLPYSQKVPANCMAANYDVPCHQLFSAPRVRPVRRERPDGILWTNTLYETQPGNMQMSEREIGGRVHWIDNTFAPFYLSNGGLLQ